MKWLILAACLLVAAANAQDPSNPKEEIRLLAEAAGLTREDVKALIENPPEDPNDVEEAILDLVAVIIDNEVEGGREKDGKEGGYGDKDLEPAELAEAERKGPRRGGKKGSKKSEDGEDGEERGPPPSGKPPGDEDGEGRGPPPSGSPEERMLRELASFLRKKGGKGPKKGEGKDGDDDLGPPPSGKPPGESGDDRDGKDGGDGDEMGPPPSGMPPKGDKMGGDREEEERMLREFSLFLRGKGGKDGKKGPKKGEGKEGGYELGPPPSGKPPGESGEERDGKDGDEMGPPPSGKPPGDEEEFGDGRKPPPGDLEEEERMLAALSRMLRGKGGKMGVKMDGGDGDEKGPPPSGKPPGSGEEFGEFGDFGKFGEEKDGDGKEPTSADMDEARRMVRNLAQLLAGRR